MQPGMSLRGTVIIYNNKNLSAEAIKAKPGYSL